MRHKKNILYIISILLIVIISSSCGKKEEANIQTTIDFIVKEEPVFEEEIKDESIEETTIETLKSNEEIVEDVISGLYGNGQERWDRLTAEGYNADEIQKLIDNIYTSTIQETENYYDNTAGGSYFEYENTGVLNPYTGVVYYNGHRETYYSQQVLPGGGLNIPGRYVAEDGTIRDENGYICVAADPSYLSYGSTVETSLGTGKVYDSGCDYGTIDIYTNW